MAIQAEVNALLMSGATPAFAGGGTTLEWPDETMTGHSFTVAQFQAFAQAVNAFVAACYLYGRGIETTAPSSSATIP